MCSTVTVYFQQLFTHMYNAQVWQVETVAHSPCRLERVLRGEAVGLRSAAACDWSTVGRAYLQGRSGKCLIPEKERFLLYCRSRKEASADRPVVGGVRGQVEDRPR